MWIQGIFFLRWKDLKTAEDVSQSVSPLNFLSGFSCKYVKINQPTVVIILLAKYNYERMCTEKVMIFCCCFFRLPPIHTVKQKRQKCSHFTINIVALSLDYRQNKQTSTDAYIHSNYGFKSSFFRVENWLFLWKLQPRILVNRN